MKAEAWIFVVCTVFFVLVSPAYWFLSYDPTGTVALVMTALLTGLVSFYLGFHATQMEPRPEDRLEGEIADGAGELGFFPPYSWWPLWCALTLGTIVLGVVIGWWLVVIGAVLGAVALSGFVFEYYRGEHAH
ncbi:MAG TPA: cytochrome c oxidase subunit 4 [Marmoricola sp.]|jgi:hypothetical protein|nr:cytochrome c oxidase subunit 4 [Marmoricola sp.]